MQHSSLFIAVVSVLMVPVAIAQDAPSITIYGQKSNAIDNTLPKVDVIYLQHDKRHAGDLRTVLRRDPALAVNLSGSGASQALLIRGMGQNYAQMTLDGQQLPSYYSYGPYTGAGRDFIETDTIKRVDVVKGMVSPKQATDALAGTVNLETYNPSDFVSGDQKIYSAIKGSYDSKNQGAGVSLTLAGGSRVKGLLIYSHRQYHELANQGDDRSKTRRDKQDLSQHNILAKAEMALAHGSAMVTAEHLKRDHTTSARYPVPTSKDKDEPMTRQRLSAALRLYDVLGVDALKTQIFGSQYKETVTSYGSTEYQQDYLGVTVDAEKSLRTTRIVHDVLFGLGYGYQNNDYVFLAGTAKAVRYLPKAQKNTFSAYIKDRLGFGDFWVAPGVRVESSKVSAKPDDLYRKNPAITAQQGYEPNEGYTKISPSLNVAHQFDSGVQLFASYARGVKHPDEANIASFDHGKFFIIPNPDLKTEQSDNYELGLSYSHASNVELKITAFQSRFRDFIAYNRRGTIGTPPKGVMHPENVNTAKIYGAELESGAHFNESWYAHAHMAWMQGRIGAASSHGVALSQAYPLKAVLGLDYARASYGAQLALTLVGKGREPDKAASKFRTPGYGLVDVEAWWQPLPKLTMSAGVYNLFDKTYWLSEDVNGMALKSRGKAVNFDAYSQPGRNFSVDVGYQF